MINCICSIKIGIYICCWLNIKMILKFVFFKLFIRLILMVGGVFDILRDLDRVDWL